MEGDKRFVVINGKTHEESEIDRKIKSLVDAVGAGDVVQERRKAKRVDHDVVKLLTEALEDAKQGDITTVSLVAIHGDRRVSTTTAGNVDNGKIGLSGDLVSQLFSLYGKLQG